MRRRRRRRPRSAAPASRWRSGPSRAWTGTCDRGGGGVDDGSEDGTMRVVDD